MVPYSTTPVEGVSSVQVISALVRVMFLADSPLMAGPSGSGVDARAWPGAGAAANAAISTAPAIERYDPGNPQANPDGLVYASNVNAMEEMANMISASRSYQSNLEVINTAKELLLRTLSLGQV